MRSIHAALFTLPILLAACAGPAPEKKETVDAIYFGGNIITVNEGQPEAEAIAVKDGMIVFVGAKADAMAMQGESTQLHDLQGRTLIPGFFDAHSHFSQVGMQAISANLLPPPDGSAKSIADIQQILRAYMDTSAMVKAHHIVIGFDYDDSQLAERRHPTRQELDAVSTELPVFAIHQSGHLGAYNSKALEMAGITADSKNPTGGTIHREKDGRTPSGLLDENAHIGAMIKLMPRFSPAEAMDMLAASQAIYVANGFTTVHDGRTDPQTVEGFMAMGKQGLFTVDIVAYPDYEMSLGSPLLEGPMMARTYADNVRIGGVKFTLDGSPQGKTAWFTQPYFQVPEGMKADYAGQPIFSEDSTLEGMVTQAFRNKWQCLFHANGDAAIDQMIRVVRKASAAVPGSDRRAVLIHGQYLRKDQVAELKELGIFSSLYPMHTFYWGDWHRESVAGPERAENISPTGWILAEGMPVSIHSDAPVTFPNSMRIFDSAVNRTTRSGYIIGPDQRLTPLQALKAMTLDAAYQHFEEASKGSLEVGKLADLVILDKDPLKVDPATIKDIRVMATIKEGRSIYTRP